MTCARARLVRRIIAALSGVTIVAGASWVAASPALFGGVMPDESEAASTVDLLVGVHSDKPGRARPEQVGVSFGSGSAKAPIATKPFLDYAIEQGRKSEVWRPPVALGVVYLWSEGAPPEVLQGVHRLARRLPQRTVVLPTPYGQGRYPVVNPTTAARVAGGGLDDQPPIPGDALAFLDATRANAADLAKDPSPVKALVIVCDGRDYQHGHDSDRFTAIGRELLAAGLSVQVVALRDAGDPAQSLANVQALATAANARLLVAQVAAELPMLIEAAGTMFFDALVVTAPLTSSLRAFGGTANVVVDATIGGERLRATLGTVTIPGNGAGPLLVALAVLLLLLAAGAGFVLWRRRTRGADDDVEALLDDLQEAVRRRVAPERAVTELSRRHPSTVGELERLDVDDLDTQRFRLLRSRAGKARVREIATAFQSAKIQASARRGADTTSTEVASVLAEGFGQGSATDCARQLRARAADQDWAAFARQGFAELTEFLKGASARHPQLRSPKARRFVLDVQDALRHDDLGGVVMAWLVRSAGPGRRGETIRITLPATVIGAGGGCDVRLAAIGAADRHVRLAHEGGAFFAEPLDGATKIEGTPLGGRRTLVEGETLEIGSAQFVFKAVVDG